MMTPVPKPFTYDHYRYMVQSALHSGYDFIGFSELNAVSDRDSDLSCLLRHDCDNDLVAAAEMARVEEALGVRSTYFVMVRSAMYNLLSFPSKALVSEIVGLGHWLGLHFDEQGCADATPDEIARRVDQERGLVVGEFGVPIDVVSFHQPSSRVLAREIPLNCVNTYDLGDELNFHYLSDSNTVWREGCPSELFRRQRYPRLQLLIHPEWWTVDSMSVDEKWDEMLRHNFALMQRSLWDREQAYTRKREITFRLRPESQAEYDSAS